MTVYHINPETGNPGICRANKKPCPHGGAENHFESKEEARASFEKRQQPSFNKVKKYDPNTAEVKEVDKSMYSSAGTAINIPAGRYFVGDPCYAVKDVGTVWQRWVNATYKEREVIAAGTIDNHLVIGLSTQYGDGEYTDQKGRVYGVDSGMIGVVDVELLKAQGLKETDIDDLGSFVTFSENTRLTRTEDGDILIGNLSIPTGDYYEEEEEDYWDDEDPYEYEDADDWMNR